MSLTDTRIRSAKPAERPYKLTDGGGLYLEVKPTGSKLWRVRYRLGGKENVFAIGDYPAVGLAEARDERTAAKKLIKQGVHPAHHRKLERIRQVLPLPGHHAVEDVEVGQEIDDGQDLPAAWPCQSLLEREHLGHRVGAHLRRHAIGHR